MKLNVAAISVLATVASALPHKRNSDQWGHIRSNVSAAACRETIVPLTWTDQTCHLPDDGESLIRQHRRVLGLPPRH